MKPCSKNFLLSPSPSQRVKALSTWTSLWERTLGDLVLPYLNLHYEHTSCVSKILVTVFWFCLTGKNFVIASFYSTAPCVLNQEVPSKWLKGQCWYFGGRSSQHCPSWEIRCFTFGMTGKYPCKMIHFVFFPVPPFSIIVKNIWWKRHQSIDWRYCTVLFSRFHSLYIWTWIAFSVFRKYCSIVRSYDLLSLHYSSCWIFFDLKNFCGTVDCTVTKKECV